jgi:hypothetical protein
MTCEPSARLYDLVCGNDTSLGHCGWTKGPVTAACYSRPYLHFATLQMTGEARFKLMAKGCAAFWFDDRQPEATRQLQFKVAHFVAKHASDTVVLRCTDLKGEYSGHGLGFKAEAVLDLELGSSLLLAKTSGVARWAKNWDHALPEPATLDLPKLWYVGQARAIETAAYALSGGKLVQAGELAP